MTRRSFCELVSVGQSAGMMSHAAEGLDRQSDYRMEVPKIVRVVDETARVLVETTGAAYSIFRSDPARIEIVQKLNGPRVVCLMELSASFAELSIDFHDTDEFVAYVPVADFGFNVRIHGDSMLSIRAGKDVRVQTKGQWLPEYSYTEAGNLLLLDGKGGYGQYIIPSAHPYGSVFEQTIPGLAFSAKGWETYFLLSATRVLMTCVAPPRPFDWRASFDDRIIQHFITGKRPDGAWYYYPSDELIEEYRRYGNILALHVWQRGAGPYKGYQVANRVDIYSKAAPWATWRHEPLDVVELRRVIATAHRYGMRVVPYMSPLFFPGNSREFLQEMERVLETYGFDGVYYDGVASDIPTAYETMRGSRKILGDKRLLYVHIPSPILGNSYGQFKYAYCPFIDTYANFMIRGEHIGKFDEQYLRYTISGYNISNTIGLVDNYDFNPEFVRGLIPELLERQVRTLFYPSGWDIYLRERSKDVGSSYYPASRMHEVLMHDYFPALDRLRKTLSVR